MPLYSCQRCGWATASSWPDAVRGHDEGCPDCPGSVELVPLAGRPQENIAAVARMGGPFEVREAVDLDGALRLTLLGGLDIVVAERLTARLQTLRAEGRTVRIDLSELEFIDCTGLKAIIDELAASRNIARILEVDRPVSAPVKRVITFMDVSSMLWPADGDGQRPALRVIDGSADRESDDSPRSREATGPPALGPPLEESADVRPGTPGASVTSDR